MDVIGAFQARYQESNTLYNSACLLTVVKVGMMAIRELNGLSISNKEIVMRRSHFLFGLLGVFCLNLGFQSDVAACDTPVYRYAMYRWEPTPYEVYFFHDKEPGDEHVKTHKALQKAIDGETVRTNVVLLPVDLNEDKDLVGVPPDVKEAWLAQKEKSTPSYMVVSPQGLKIYSGALVDKDISALIDSPLRKATANHLAEGKAAVFLLLASGDKDADSKAEAELKKLVADVASGKLNLYGGPEDLFPPEKDLKKENANEKDGDGKDASHEIAYVKVSPEDMNEQWLVRQLMSVEDDLGDFVGQPMVFAVYGRGRALPPFINKGITRDNLVECVEFVTSACSCTVKEQNPGVDLLTSYDWEAAAEKVAERFGAEEGNENQFGIDEFFPDLVIGGEGAMQAKPANNPEAKSSGERGVFGTLVELAVEYGTDKLAELAGARNTSDEEKLVARASSDNPDAQVANSDPEKRSEPSEIGGGSGNAGSVALATDDPGRDISNSVSSEAKITSSRLPMITTILGVGVALLVLIGATFFMFRPS